MYEKKSIWILNHHAELNGHRHFELGKQLAREGIDVTIISSSFSHTQNRYYFEGECTVQEIQERFRFIWLRTKPKYTGNSAKRILNMLSYWRMVTIHAKKWWIEYGKPDIVIGSSVHPFAWEAAYWVSKHTGARYIAEVRDLWPLSLIEIMGMSIYHPLVKLFAWLEKRAYHRAYKILTTMPYAYNYICKDKYSFPRSKVIWIPNGIDIEQIDKSLINSKESLPNELEEYLAQNWCCVYAGSITKSQCVDFIIDAANVLAMQGQNNICFAIIGDGDEKKEIIEKVISLKLNSVHFFERISKEQVALALRRSRCCLAAHRNLPIYRYGLSLNKLNDYLLSGIPTLFACDANNVVKESGGGIAIDFGDPQIFANAILKVYHMAEAEREEICTKGIQEIREQYDTRAIAQKLINAVM